MSLAKKPDDKITIQEYLKGELLSEVKHEYYNGHVYAMAGASDNHNLISVNVLREISTELKKQKSSCTSYVADMKVHIADKGNHFFYPDVMVVCDSDDNESDYYKKSPVIIVEVLSPSTRKNDSTSKRLLYFNLESLEEYVLIEQDICQIQVFRRKENWQAAFYFLGDEITFKSINVTLKVEDIYYQVKNENILTFLKEIENKHA
jgi:Uma2 family endonuclease